MTEMIISSYTRYNSLKGYIKVILSVSDSPHMHILHKQSNKNLQRHGEHDYFTQKAST